MYAACLRGSMLGWKTTNESHSAFITSATLSGGIAANIALIIGLYTFVFGPMLWLPAWGAGSLALLPFVLNHLYFVSSGRYKRLLRRLDGLPLQKQRRLMLVGLAYVASSYAVAILFAAVAARLKR
jgi:hypothetical protein